MVATATPAVLVAEVRGLLTRAYGPRAPSFTDEQITHALTHFLSEKKQPAAGAAKVEKRLAKETAVGPDADVALAGADGRKVELLLSRAQREGTDKLTELAAAAVKRLLTAKGSAGGAGIGRAKRLFSPEELAALAAQIVETNAPAELLGRTRIRERAETAEKLQGARPAAGGKRFSAQPTAFHGFDESKPLAPMTPTAALEYFKRLLPQLGVDPERWGPLLERHAFTLAVATDSTLLARIQELIAEKLETGQGVSAAPREIERLLDDAGAGPTKKGYAEMVYRTNAMDAYNQGAQDELQQVADTFPVWMYSNPNDGRSRPEHASRDGNYYPTSAAFVSVRGTDISEAANCRCVPIEIDAWEWADLRKSGARIVSGYADVPGVKPATTMPTAPPSEPPSEAPDIHAAPPDKEPDWKKQAIGAGARQAAQLPSVPTLFARIQAFQARAELRSEEYIAVVRDVRKLTVAQLDKLTEMVTGETAASGKKAEKIDYLRDALLAARKTPAPVAPAFPVVAPAAPAAPPAEPPANSPPERWHLRRDVQESMLRIDTAAKDARERYGLTQKSQAELSTHVESVLSRLPAKAVEAFRKNVKTIVLANKPTEWIKSLGWLERVALRVARTVTGGAFDPLDAGGLYDSKNRAMYLSAATRRSFEHEIGHAVDEGASDTTEWKGIWKDEIVKGHLSNYARTSPSEGFAEYFRLLANNATSAKSIFPRAFAFLQARGLI